VTPAPLLDHVFEGELPAQQGIQPHDRKNILKHCMSSIFDAPAAATTIYLSSSG
jgi:hypothetical protein